MVINSSEADLVPRYGQEGITYTDPACAARYLATGAWIGLSAGVALRQTTERAGDRPAFISDERTVSFREMNRESDLFAAALLRIGLAPGDRVIFQLGTNVDTAIALLACYKIGLIPVCAVPQYRELEIGQLAERTRPRAHFVQADFSAFDLCAFAQSVQCAHPSIEHIVTLRNNGQGTSSLDSVIALIDADEAEKTVRSVAPSPADVLSFQLSGGTTGVPKIIPRFHAEYLGHSAAWMRTVEIDEDSRLIWSLPLLHNAGQIYILTAALLRGVTSVLMPTVDIRRMLELIEEHGVTHALSIGPIAPKLIAYTEVGNHDLSSLRYFGAMNRADALEAHLGVSCSNMFGMTEGLLLASSPNAPERLRHISQGYSGCPEDEIRIVDPDTGTDVAEGVVGEMWFRGPSSLRAYLAAPEATADTVTAEGYVRSGDLMRAIRVDDQVGYVFEGRIRDNVNRGGEKISCEEVEHIVSQHPSVADAKLVAIPDPVYGEKGCIVVILKSGQPAPTIRGLIELFVARGAAKFKCPERIEVFTEYPVTRIGKFDRAELKRQVEARIVFDGQGA